MNLASKLVKKAEGGVILEKLLPAAIVLLNPFWSPFPKTYIDRLETGEFVQLTIEQIILPKNILVEVSLILAHGNHNNS